MLVELSVVEQRYHAVMEVVSGGVPVVEVHTKKGSHGPLSYTSSADADKMA